MGAKAIGRVNATMPGMVLKELQAADVKALSFSRGQAWDDLLEDLLLWHISREVNSYMVAWEVHTELYRLIVGPVTEFRNSHFYN